MPSVADGDQEHVLHIPRSMAGLAALAGWVDQVTASLHLGKAAEYALRLCAEEAATNLVMHGVAGGRDDAGAVTLRAEPLAGALRLVVEDRCDAFDPLAVAPPEAPARLEDARVGGLGIHLLRRYAREVVYTRENGMNRLVLTIGR
jgi:anti-sigma regulatory factor (Ser/Thr protein kinase)